LSALILAGFNMKLEGMMGKTKEAGLTRDAQN